MVAYEEREISSIKALKVTYEGRWHHSKSWSASTTSKLDLPGEYNVSATFNVSDLSPFDVSDDLRTNPSQEEGNDECTANKWSADLIQVPIGPVTRVRAKRFKEILNAFIQSIWVEESSWRSNRDDKSVVQDWVSVVQALE